VDLIEAGKRRSAFVERVDEITPAVAQNPVGSVASKTSQHAASLRQSSYPGGAQSSPRRLAVPSVL
jgi:hypothetical protein